MIKIYDFYADWCGPCRQMEPYIKEAKELYPSNVFKINIEENKELAVKHQVRSIPTIVVVDKDEFGETEIARITGNPGKAALLEFIKKHLNGK